MNSTLPPNGGPSLRSIRALLEVTSADDANSSWAQDKFVTRARTLFYTRVGFLIIGLGVLAVAPWSEALGITSHWSYAVYVAIVLYSILSYTVVEHPTAGRITTFITLCLDLLVLVYLTVASGGLQSPLLATQLLFTILFAILFPKPLAVLPPLLTLPVVARIDVILGNRDLVELLYVLWYLTMNFIVVYVLVYLNEREESAHRDVVDLQHRLRELAVMEERNRLAREIHDGLGASLSSLIIQSEYCEQLAKDAGLKAEIHELKEAAEESIEELRRSLQMMREDFDLVQSLDDYCKTSIDRHKLDVRFTKQGTERALGSDAQLTLFRILQESLTNAAKHAHASHVDVRLCFESDAVFLVIKDDGQGFDTKALPPGHYGLLNMRERADKLYGRVNIESTPGHGTHIALSIPYPAAPSAG